MRPERSAQWFPLDNAAKIYPVINVRTRSSVFRLAALMRDPVDPLLLQQAVDTVMPRFPMLAVRLKRGVFWYYFEHNPHVPRVQREAANPCMRMRWNENNHLLLRVCYYDRRICVEFFHSLTDGTGGLVFLKTLVGEYLRRCGVTVSYDNGVLDPHEPPRRAEMENAFSRYAAGRTGQIMPPGGVYHPLGTDEPVHTLHIISGQMSLKAALAKARSYSVSLTEYLCAHLLQALDSQRQALGLRPRPVRVSVPVNLRAFFPSETLRNFSFYIHAGIDPRYGRHTFAETLRQVHHGLRLYLNAKYLKAQFTANVRLERNPLLRATPLFLKKPIMRLAFYTKGENLNSITLSNLGAVRLPESMSEHVTRFEFILGPLLYNRVNCAMASYGDKLVLSFTSTMAETDIEREFFRGLVRDGLHVLVQSNRQGTVCAPPTTPPDPKEQS